VNLLSVVGLIACKDANLFEAFSCSWTRPATFYKLLGIERPFFLSTLPYLSHHAAITCYRQDKPTFNKCRTLAVAQVSGDSVFVGSLSTRPGRKLMVPS